MRRTAFTTKRRRNYSGEKAKREYRVAHPWCEACRIGASDETHHIVTKGSGGTDDEWNFLALCVNCHHGVFHGTGGGWKRGTELFPHLAGKIAAARMRMGRKVK